MYDTLIGYYKEIGFVITDVVRVQHDIEGILEQSLFFKIKFFHMFLSLKNIFLRVKVPHWIHEYEYKI